MNNRDLKADLELCKKYKDNIGPWLSKDGFPTKHLVGAATFLNQAREGWPHAIERAIEAEALNRDLVEALKRAHEYIGGINSFYGQGLQVYGWHLNGAPEPLDNFIDSNGGCEAEEFVGRVLTKAKEVLGDEI